MPPLPHQSQNRYVHSRPSAARAHSRYSTFGYFPIISSRAFSLVELLTVLAILSVLATFSAVSLSGTRGSAGITSGGNMVSDLFNLARQNSISKRVMTAVAMPKSVQSENYNYRSFVLIEKGAGSTNWTPVSRWTTLPEGIVVDKTQSLNFIENAPDVSVSDLPPIDGKHTQANECAYQIFLPDGRLCTRGFSSQVSPSLKIVEAASQEGNIRNYYEITLNPLTGTSKIDRP